MLYQIYYFVLLLIGYYMHVNIALQSYLLIFYVENAVCNTRS